MRNAAKECDKRRKPQTHSQGWQKLASMEIANGYTWLYKFRYIQFWFFIFLATSECKREFIKRRDVPV